MALMTASVLHGENVRQIAIVAFGPDVVASLRVDKSCGDANPRARRALPQHIAHAKLTRHLL